MYVFNKITVTPQLPERINKLSEIAGNLWWAWNTDFLKLFKIIETTNNTEKIQNKKYKLTE